jgi:hypothetical protein
MNNLTAIKLGISALLVLPAMGFERGDTFSDEEKKIIKQEIQIAKEELEKAKEELGVELHNLKVELGDDDISISLNIDDDMEFQSKGPKMGVYPSELTFEQAYKLRYPHNYGVLLDGVVKGGNADKAGLMEEDIIAEWDGTIVRYESHLRRLIKSQDIGDTVAVKYYRDGNEYSTQLFFAIPVEKLDKKKRELIQIEENSKPRKSHPGYGGGGIIPTFLTPMVDGNKDLQFTNDVNSLLSQLGFEQKLDSAGVLFFGGGGNGNVGKGWFLGGYGLGSGQTFQTSIGDSIERSLSLGMGFGGFTIDKRVALGKKLAVSVGAGIGGGAITIDIDQRENGGYDWDNLNTQLIEQVSSSIQLSRGYLTLQPRAQVYVRLLPWMSLRLEGGYLYGYSMRDGWDVKIDSGSKASDLEDKFEIGGSPNTPFEGATASVGLWFGF